LKEIRNIGPLLQMGWIVALSILIPLGLGLWLDHRFATAPLFVLIGALVGIVASTIGAVRVTIRVIEATKQPPENTANLDKGVHRKEDRA